MSRVTAKVRGWVDSEREPDIEEWVSQERTTVHTSPAGLFRASIVVPVFRRIAEHNPATSWWRGLRTDPDLHGLAPEYARPRSVTLTDAGGRAPWTIPIDDPLTASVAWHPTQPRVAGLAADGRRARLWIADGRTRTVTVFRGFLAATSLAGLASPCRPPIAWLDDDRLVLLTPAPGAPESRRPQLVPVVNEASGPAYVGFEPDLSALIELAGVHLSLVDPRLGTAEPLTPKLLVRDFHRSPTSPDQLLVEYADLEPGADLAGVGTVGARWRVGLVDVRGGPVEIRDTTESLTPPTIPAASNVDHRPVRRRPVEQFTIPTGEDTARLAVWGGRRGSAGAGPLLLWIRGCAPGRMSPVHRPVALVGTGRTTATLDIPLHWRTDVTLESLDSQILGTIRRAVDILRRRQDETIVIGGHSFDATLALRALANIPEIAAAIVHSGCYNRTHTPTGFQHERRTYWAVPEIYAAFSALMFADRLDRPVLIVHGADDPNPATTPEQAVALYRGIVATGGTATLVLLPAEGHSYTFAESLLALSTLHRRWLDR